MATLASFPSLTTAALLTGTLFLTTVVARRAPQPLSMPLETIQSEVSGWRSAGDARLDDRTGRVLNATSYLSRSYRKNDLKLELFIAFYAQQRAGESMHSPRNCLPGTGWEIWKQEAADVPVDNGIVQVNKYSIQNFGTKMLMLYWYQSSGRIVANEYAGKFLLARDTLLNRGTAGSIVRMLLPDVRSATDEGVAFASKLIPEVHRCFTGQGHPSALP
jgi:EpsI family protein